MKIQNLAVIFIIIMLPISMVLTSYVENQVQTLELQISYDTKLTNATNDALKAFQLNTINNSTSDLANSKIRDIEASVNTFFNSIASNFNMVGYNSDILQDYVPALVYTMYDGYYIYTPFTNTLDKEDEGIEYTNGEIVYNLKPYVHYSCRYRNGGTDVVITYSLDNAITVEGIVSGEGAVYKSGYLLDNISGSGDSVKYRNIPIQQESLSENVKGYYLQENQTYRLIEGNFQYYKTNGVKYYYDAVGDEKGYHWFSILGDEISYTNLTDSFDINNNDSAIQYYNNAKEFTDWIRKSDLGNLTTSDAVDEQGSSLEDVFGTGIRIFDRSGDIPLEDPNSLFNQQRLAVIRYSIEKNLSIAIANYNNYSGATANFQMPELKEDEWEKILNNVSIISFMQGLSIGGKIYNGYAIVTNTKTKEVVNTDSIYITTGNGKTGYYHRATDKEFDLDSSQITGAFLNIDFERKSATNGTETRYFYSQENMACYSSIVSQTGCNFPDNIYEYIAGQGGVLAQTYFTALGRERFSMFRSNAITTDWP